MKKKEIELRFVVEPEDFKKIISKYIVKKDIVQGYLFGSMHFRVRNSIDEVFGSISKQSRLTIKSERESITRDEFEWEIPYDEGVALMEQFATTVVRKTRYILRHNEQEWEIDDFHGKNAGLIIAELEIPKEDHSVKLPSWIKKKNDVSNDDKYYNYSLSNKPYTEWEK